MGYVYKITNTVNGKAYIGISIHDPEKGRIKDHLSGHGNRILARAVKKYGKDAFTYEVLEANVFDEFLPELEVAYIANYNTVVPHGYNLTYGGEVAKTLSAETRRKMSEVHQNRSPETLHKMSIGRRGIRHTAETRRKMCETRKGEKHPFFGKKHSEKTRRKLSEINKLPEYAPAHAFFFSLDVTIHLPEKRKLLYSKFPNVKRHTLRSWVRKWTVKNPDANRHSEYVPAQKFFFSLPSDMPLKEKRKMLFTNFPNVRKGTIYKWVKKWHCD